MPPNKKRSPLSARMTAVALVGLVSALACIVLAVFPDISIVPDSVRTVFIFVTIIVTIGSLVYLVAGLRQKAQK